MNRRFVLLFVVAAFVALVPFRSPAPLIYTPGEGWYYEPSGEKADWMRPRAKEQLDVAEQAFTNKNYSVTLHAAHRILKVWPLSDYAPRAEYLVGCCLEADGKDEAAFNAYQDIIEKYPRSENFNDVLWRQYGIAGRFLGGEWFRVFWGTVPLYPSMDETAQMFEKIVKGGPYSEVAPHAQLQIGAAREKQKNFEDAVKAYETAADRYHDQPDIASDALFREGVSWQKQAATAEYDQSTAGKSIAAFTDFKVLFPDDKRVPDAEKAMILLKAQQVEGNFKIAQFYENNKVLGTEQRRNGAIVYYNEVLQLDPNSTYAAQARQRIEALMPLVKTPPAS
jgi:outer membrane protein assembly factor BamD